MKIFLVSSMALDITVIMGFAAANYLSRSFNLSIIVTVMLFLAVWGALWVYHDTKKGNLSKYIHYSGPLFLATSGTLFGLASYLLLIAIGLLSQVLALVRDSQPIPHTMLSNAIILSLTCSFLTVLNLWILGKVLRDMNIVLTNQAINAAKISKKTAIVNFIGGLLLSIINPLITFTMLRWIGSQYP